jgi:K+-sensing histidine kinase KdpD
LSDPDIVNTALRYAPVAGLLLALAALAAVVWFYQRRRTRNRQMLRALYTLSEKIITAASAAEIAEQLSSVLPSVTKATSVELYLFNRSNNSLERVPTPAEPEPMAASLESPPDGLANAAVVCYRNRTLLSVPDAHRNPLVASTRMNLPRSALFVPLHSPKDILGVLEIDNARAVGYFSPEEQLAAQHLANQIAAALKLQEQQAMRDQLFESEKLAATGQLVTGVAGELREPIESIVKLAVSIAERGTQTELEPDLDKLLAESQRADEIVSRLVSFGNASFGPEAERAPAIFDLNALVQSLIEFRGPAWSAQSLHLQARLSPEQMMVRGLAGQIEQVLLSLLLHAEQRAAQYAPNTLAIQTSVMGSSVHVEIGYSAPSGLAEREGEQDPFSRAVLPSPMRWPWEPARAFCELIGATSASTRTPVWPGSPWSCRSARHRRRQREPPTGKSPNGRSHCFW